MIDVHNITVLWNPSSGSEELAAEILWQLRLWPEVVIERPKDADDAELIVRELGDSHGTLVAAGGDGTVRSTVNAMCRSNSSRTLGILPLGSGNDLARTLGIPFDAASALQTLRTGRLQPLDVLKFQTENQQGWCANMITGGNTGRYLDLMTDEIKTRWGAFCYLRGVVDVLQDLEAFDLTLSCDDQPAESFQALNVFIANGRTSGGGMVVSPEARVDDGCLDVIIVREGDPGEIAHLTATYFLSDYREHPLIVYRRATRIQLLSDPSLLLTADGDAIGETPLKVEVCASAMQVKVPEQKVEFVSGTRFDTPGNLG